LSFNVFLLWERLSSREWVPWHLMDRGWKAAPTALKKLSQKHPINNLEPRDDVAAKRHKKHKNKISHLTISIGYEIKIR
jgi:hypothetical protein